MALKDLETVNVGYMSTLVGFHFLWGSPFMVVSRAIYICF